MWYKKYYIIITFTTEKHEVLKHCWSEAVGNVTKIDRNKGCFEPIWCDSVGNVGRSIKWYCKWNQTVRHSDARVQNDLRFLTNEGWLTGIVYSKYTVKIVSFHTINNEPQEEVWLLFILYWTDVKSCIWFPSDLLSVHYSTSLHSFHYYTIHLLPQKTKDHDLG